MTRVLKRALLVGLALVFFFGARLLGLDQVLTLEGMRSWVEAYGGYAPLGFIGICILGIVLYLPEGLLLTFGGAVFGGWAAFAYGWVAAVVGTTVTFLVARYVARDYVQRVFVGQRAAFRRFDERFSRHGFLWILLLRTVLGLTPPLNWAVGVTSVPLRSYVAGTALGLVPNIGVFVYFGGSIAVALEEGNWLTPEVLVPSGLVLLSITAGLYAGRRLLAGE